MLSESPKCKNDEKRKGLPARYGALALLLIVLLIGASALYLLRPTPLANPQFPAARLFYTSDGHPYTVNLQTGERLATERPRVIIGPNDPIDIRAAQVEIDADEHQSFVASPDHQWLVGWKHISSRREWDLHLYDRQGKGRSRSLGIFLGVRAISWSPDSQWIIFTAYMPPPPGERIHQGGEELWRVDISDGEITRLTNNNFRDSDPNVSPDGSQIAYTSAADGYNRLYLMDVGTGESRLLTSDFYGYSPMWSPDGQWLVFMTNQFGNRNDIWIVRVDGTDPQAVASGPESDEDPLWLP